MDDVRQLLERQATWQRERRLLSWPEKVRMAEAMRETAAAFAALRERERPGPRAEALEPRDPPVREPRPGASQGSPDPAYRTP